MKQLFEEQDGKLSMSRFVMFVLIIGYTICSGYIAYINKSIPEIPWSIVTLLSALYGINTDALKINLSNKKEG